MSLVSSAVCTGLCVYVCNAQKWSSSLPLSVPTHWPHSDVYPAVLLAAVSEWANPSPWCFKWNLLSVTGPVFRTNWASSLSGHVWLYRQGGLGGERLHNTAGCSLQHKWFIGQWELEWKTKIREGGRIIEREEVKGRRAWIGRGNEKSKSEGRGAEGGHGFSQSLLEPGFLWMMNSWKSLKRERKEEENEGGYKEKDGRKKDILVNKKELLKAPKTLCSSGLPPSIWLNHTCNNTQQFLQKYRKETSRSPSARILDPQKADPSGETSCSEQYHTILPKVLMDLVACVKWSCPQTHATVHPNIIIDRGGWGERPSPHLQPTYTQTPKGAHVFILIC